MSEGLPPRSPLAARWTLDPDVVFLNHGSYGACPSSVLAAQGRLRDRIEREPVRFFARELEPLLDDARAELATFLDADPDDLALLHNATTAVSTVLASLALAPGDELLTTDHAYGACKNALDATAERTGARVVVARLPWPVGDGDEDAILAAVLDAVTARTRLALVDHVTSPTALVLPIARIVAELGARGVDTLVDGAHAPGMVDLSLRAVGAAYFTGNCHKWLCAPKGAAFLHVRSDRQARVRPLVTSHGRSAPRSDRSRFRLEFDWCGTDDPTALLVVRDAIRDVGALCPGGWPEVRARNHALVVAGRRVLCDALGVAPPCPDAMLGSIAAIPLAAPTGAPADAALQEALWTRWRIEVPLMPRLVPGERLLRISAQLYDTLDEYRYLADALLTLRADRRL